MIVPTDIREKLSKLVASTNIDDATKQEWLEELKKEEPSPSVLYEIAKTMDNIREREDKFSDEVIEINEFFDEQEKSLEDSGNKIESDITNLAQQTENLKQEVKELEQEFGAKGESHIEKNNNDQETRSTHEYTRSGQTINKTAQSQHLRVQQPVNSSTPAPRPSVVPKPSGNDKGNNNDDDKKVNKEETHNNPPQPTGYY